MPHSLSVIISERLATMYELETIYGSEDAYNFLEIIAVNNVNDMIARG